MCGPVDSTTPLALVDVPGIAAGLEFVAVLAQDVRLDHRRVVFEPAELTAQSISIVSGIFALMAASRIASHDAEIIANTFQ